MTRDGEIISLTKLFKFFKKIKLDCCPALFKQIIFINVCFQAAVPKSFTLQMLSPSGSVLPPGGVITQEMRVVSTSSVSRIFNNSGVWYLQQIVLQ